MSAAEVEPVTCPVRSPSGLYCEEDGAEPHDVHAAVVEGVSRSWVTPSRATVPSGSASPDDPRNLWRLVQLREELEVGIERCVEAARRDGKSWAWIGEQLCVTKQSAYERYAPKRAAPVDPGAVGLFD